MKTSFAIILMSLLLLLVSCGHHKDMSKDSETVSPETWAEAVEVSQEEVDANTWNEEMSDSNESDS